jgi:enamine deaminase RidA (YjgF/YER057c/UK114 family)
LQTLADQLLLQKFSPAAVLTNADGDVLFISGRTGISGTSGRQGQLEYSCDGP